MAHPSSPLDPDTKDGQKVLEKRASDQVMVQRPSAMRTEVRKKTRWAIEVCALQNAQGAQPSVADTGNILDKAHVYETRGRRSPDKWVKRILHEMSTQPGIQQGVHYNGIIMLNSDGTACFNQSNKDITLTSNGVFTLVGLLAPNQHRVHFLNDIWDVLTAVYQVYMQMRADYQAYNQQRVQGKQMRNDGEQALLAAQSIALGVSTGEANRCFMNATQLQGYRPMFHGQRATPALRAAKLIKMDEKAGVIHELFSVHGNLIDQARLSLIAESIKLRTAAIQPLATLALRKEAINDTIKECTEHFTRNGSFNIPFANKTQQTKAMVETQSIKRRRLGN